MLAGNYPPGSTTAARQPDVNSSLAVLSTCLPGRNATENHLYRSLFEGVQSLSSWTTMQAVVIECCSDIIGIGDFILGDIFLAVGYHSMSHCPAYFIAMI